MCKITAAPVNVRKSFGSVDLSFDSQIFFFSTLRGFSFAFSPVDQDELWQAEYCCTNGTNCGRLTNVVQTVRTVAGRILFYKRYELWQADYCCTNITRLAERRYSSVCTVTQFSDCMSWVSNPGRVKFCSVIKTFSLLMNGHGE